MVQINFTHAQAKDDGWGLEINGRDLRDIISVALGVREPGEKERDYSKTPFRSNCCNISITIDPIASESTICFGDTENDIPLEQFLEGSYNGDAEKA